MAHCPCCGQELLTMAEAARRLGIKAPTLQYKTARRGHGGIMRIGGYLAAPLGTWRDVAASPGDRRHVAPEERDRMIALYDQGMKLDDIARAVGRHCGTVGGVIAKAGRRRQRRPEEIRMEAERLLRGTAITSAQRRVVEVLARTGSFAQAGRALGMSRESVRQLFEYAAGRGHLLRRKRRCAG